jgi:hypothetical protein
VTIDVDVDLPLFVLRVKGKPRLWAVHALHTAANPGLSPFIRVKERVYSQCLTVHLVQRNGRITLARAYAGEYHPPLPWQNSARGITGECRRFWRTHAYRFRPDAIVLGSRTGTEPDWL